MRLLLGTSVRVAKRKPIYHRITLVTGSRFMNDGNKQQILYTSLEQMRGRRLRLYIIYVRISSAMNSRFSLHFEQWERSY